MITKATGKEPYVVGKPNPMMFRSAMNRIGAHSENTAMIGDRMDTDIIAGIEAGLHTILVLTGISDQAEIERYPFRPDEVVESVADLTRRRHAGAAARRPSRPARRLRLPVALREEPQFRLLFTGLGGSRSSATASPRSSSRSPCWSVGGGVGEVAAVSAAQFVPFVLPRAARRRVGGPLRPQADPGG